MSVEGENARAQSMGIVLMIGVGCISAGIGYLFGLGYGLLSFGVCCLSLVGLWIWAEVHK